MLRLLFSSASAIASNTFKVSSVSKSYFHHSSFLLVDKPYNPNKGGTLPRKSKFADIEEGERPVKVQKSDEEKQRKEIERKEREKKKKETRTVQIEMQKKKDALKESKKEKTKEKKRLKEDDDDE